MAVILGGERENNPADRDERLWRLAVDEPGAWRKIAELIRNRKPRDYDAAIEILVDLRDISASDGRTAEFQQRVAGLRARHPRKTALLDQLDRANLT